MSHYNEITVGWPDNPRVKLLTHKEVRALVKNNQWDKLGQIFNFVPVYHFEGKNFIDWRCVPQNLINAIKNTPKEPSSPRVYSVAVENMNRVQKRKHIRALMLKGDWDMVYKLYRFLPRFTEASNGEHVIDWSNVSWDVQKILGCGGVIRRTLYTKEGGIYDPKRKPKQKLSEEILAGRGKMIERVKRKSFVRHTLEERISIRERLYESQGSVCHYCKSVITKNTEDGKFLVSRHWTIDHKTPVSRGGTNEESNLVGACEHCNKNKDCLTEEEFLLTAFLRDKINNLEQAKNLI